MRAPALLTLTLATFAIGTTEFAVQGLLPEIAADLDVGIPSAGLLITGYALGVALGGPVLAVLTSRLESKTALLALMAIFVAGHVLCAIAPEYGLLMAARVVTSFCHGAFFGIGSVVAVRIAPPDRRVSSVALMWAGIAASNILGVPAGTVLGHAFGWRATFWAVTLVGLIAMAAIWFWLPRTGRQKSFGLSQELSALANPQVQLALALTVLLCAGTFSVFTYISVTLTEVARISASGLPAYLVVFGTGGVIGMQAGGRLGDRNLAATIIGAFIALSVIYAALPLAFEKPATAAIMMFVWGFAFYFPAAPIQLRVVAAAADAPNLASTLVQSGFNLGNAIGPFAGAAAISFGFGYASLPWIGVVFSLSGAALALWSLALESRNKIPIAGKTPVRQLS